MSQQRYARALYTFEPERREENLLPLREGQLVLVTEERDDGWWGGVDPQDGRTGFFPANYVEYTNEQPSSTGGLAGGGAGGGGPGYGTAAGAGVAGAAAGYGASRMMDRQHNEIPTIQAGDQTYTGKDSYVIEEEKWYLREKKPRPLLCGIVLSKWQYRFWILQIFTILNAVLITLTILVITPAILNALVAGSTLRFDAVTISNPDDAAKTFVMRASATLFNAGPFNANINPTEMVLSLNNPYSEVDRIGAGLEIGRADLASVHVSGTTHFTQTVLFRVTNTTNLAVFNKVLTTSPDAFVHVRARPTVTPAIWNVDWELPFHYHGTPLDKDIHLAAFNGLKNLNVTRFDLSQSTGSQIIVTTGVDIFNPSIFTINPLGVLSVDFYYLGQKLGSAHTNYPAVATLGVFHLDLTGVINVPGGDLTAFNALMQNYLTGKPTVVQAVATPGAESSIGLFAPGLSGFTLATLTPGFTQSLVQSISFNSLSIKPMDSSENVIFSADLTLIANSPAGPNGYVLMSAVTLQAEVLGPFGDIIGVLTTTETAYPTPVYAEGKNTTTTFNVRINNALLDVTGYEESYLNFVYNFSQVDNITLSNVGKSNAVITVSVGSVTVYNITLAATATTPGLQGLVSTQVQTVGVAGVAPCSQSGGGYYNSRGECLCGLEATNTATVNNPSITSINITEANLGLYFECVRLGTLSAQPLYIQPGMNTLSLAGIILPPEEDLVIAGIFFSNFLNGLPSSATLRGDPVPGHRVPLPKLPGCDIVTSVGDGGNSSSSSPCCECGECPQHWTRHQKIAHDRSRKMLHEWKVKRTVMHRDGSLGMRDAKMMCPNCTSFDLQEYAGRLSRQYGSIAPEFEFDNFHIEANAYNSTPQSNSTAVTSSYTPPENTFQPNYVATPKLDALHLTQSCLTVTTTILFPPQKLLLSAEILSFGLIFDPACRAGYCPVFAATTTNVGLGLPPGISFPLQALSSSAVFNVYFNGRESITLNVPQTPVTHFHTRGPTVPPTYQIPDLIQLTLVKNPVIIDNFDSFSNLNAQLLNTYSGTIHIEALTDAISSTDAGQLPLYSAPLVTDATLRGVNSFNDVDGISLIQTLSIDIIGGAPNFLRITSALRIINPSDIFIVNGQAITFDLWYQSVQGRGTQRVGNLTVPNFAIQNPLISRINNYVGFGYFDPPAIQKVGAEFLGNYVNRISSTVFTTGATCNLVHNNGAGGCNSVGITDIIHSPLYGTGTTIPLLQQGTHEFETTVIIPGLDHNLVLRFYLDLGAFLGSLTRLLANPTVLLLVLAQVIASGGFFPASEAERMKLLHLMATNEFDTYEVTDEGHLLGAGLNVSTYKQHELIAKEFHRLAYESADSNIDLLTLIDLRDNKPRLLELAALDNEMNGGASHGVSSGARKLLQASPADIATLIVGLVAILQEAGIGQTGDLNNPPLSIPTQVTANNSFSVPLQVVAANLVIYGGTPRPDNPPIATYIHNVDLNNAQCSQPIIPAHEIFTVPCLYINALVGSNNQATFNVLIGTAFNVSYISAVGTLTVRIGGPGGFVYEIPQQAINVPSHNAPCPQGAGLDCGCGVGNKVCGTDFSNPNAGNH